MTAIHRKRSAQDDIESAIRFYLTEAGDRIAIAFIDAVETAIDTIRDYPEAGSTRIGERTGRPHLRSLGTAGYPYLVFYRIVGDHVEILRVLHTSRDLPNILSQPES